jgi:hypothetical protein
VTRPPDNVWIKTWCRQFLALGPFDAAGQSAMGLDAPFIDEPGASPAPGRPAGEREWRVVTSPHRLLDLTRTFGPQDNHVAYLAARVRSQTEQAAQLRIGSDDGCKVWHNGKLVLIASAPRAVAPDQDIVEVTLAAGDYLFLMKVANGSGGWAAMLRLTDLQGGPLPGIVYMAQ